MKYSATSRPVFQKNTVLLQDSNISLDALTPSRAKYPVYSLRCEQSIHDRRLQVQVLLRSKKKKKFINISIEGFLLLLTLTGAYLFFLGLWCNG